MIFWNHRVEVIVWCQRLQGCALDFPPSERCANSIGGLGGGPAGHITGSKRLIGPITTITLAVVHAVLIEDLEALPGTAREPLALTVERWFI